MVFGLFSKDRALKRTIERATNKLAQHTDRWAAMEKLAQDGSEEALLALCKRFSFSYDKSVEDEQEKQWTVETLVSKGPQALGPLRTYMKSAASIAYPLEILGRIADPPEVLEVVDALMEVEEPGYTRDPTKKKQLIDWLADWKRGEEEAVASRVAPYLADFDENVRISAAEAIGQKPHAVAAPTMAKAMVNPEEESKRLKLRIAETLATNEWELGDHFDAVKAMLDDELSGYSLKHDKLSKK